MRELMGSSNISRSADDIAETMDSLLTADGLFCVDRNQRIVHWAPSAERVIGFSAAEVMGRPCYEVLGPNQPPTHPHCQKNCPVVVNARRRRPTRDFDVCIRSENGDSWLNVSIVLADDGERRAPLVVHLVRDVTDRRIVDSLTAAAGAESERDEDEPPNNGGLPPLSRRERQVIQLLAHGDSAAAVAASLGLSPITVRNHITRAMSKLGVRTRLEAVVHAAKAGLL